MIAVVHPDEHCAMRGDIIIVIIIIIIISIIIIIVIGILIIQTNTAS